MTESVVEMEDGTMIGEIINGIHMFKGIPYGEDTGGEHRFRPPIKKASWPGVLQAKDYGPDAPQSRVKGDQARHGYQAVVFKTGLISGNASSPVNWYDRRLPCLQAVLTMM